MDMDEKQVASAPLDFKIQLDTIRSGYTPSHCWVHARAGAIPAAPSPVVVMTLQQLQLSGSDVFGPLHEMRTDDLGSSWSGPISQAATLGQRMGDAGLHVGVCDFTPSWHAATGCLLGAGHTVAYRGGDVKPQPHFKKVAYSVYDPDHRTWSTWAGMQLPSSLPNAGAGSSQRFDLENGNILLPVYYKEREAKFFSSAVLLCRFDGSTLNYVRHGSSLTLPEGRGYYEPSITRYNEQFYMTLRADHHGGVTRSKDGLQYEAPMKWMWDDGTEVPTYNTQQHWVTHSEGLYLVYTRKTGTNDHVFRHRAPLFIAQVNPVRMCLIKDTERVLVPERGARLGNFAVVHVSEQETWVTVTEWMQPAGCEKYGSNNSIFAARILWNHPNKIRKASVSQ